MFYDRPYSVLVLLPVMFACVLYFKNTEKLGYCSPQKTALVFASLLV